MDPVINERRRIGLSSTPEGKWTAEHGKWAKRKFRFTRNDWMGYLFSAPLIVGVIVFAIYPMFAALFMSFHQTSGLNLSGTWVGLSNYQYALEDSIFWQALSNTFVMGIWSVLLGIALSFVLASLINNLKWHLGRNFSKRYIFCPMSCQALLQACCSPSCFSVQGRADQLCDWFVRP